MRRWLRNLFRKNKNKLPSKEELYVLSWGEVSGFSTQYFSFTGTYYEILDYICMLQIKGDVFTELNIDRHDQHQLPRDGHWHTVEGKPQYHRWEDCPENYNDRSRAICGGYSIDTKPRH